MSSDTRENTVGFVGLGMMGGPMAANILKAGHPLVAYDIDREKNERVAALGAQIASGPADVASRAQRVVSMVDTTAQSEEVTVGAGGFIDEAQPGDVVISMSTIDPTARKRCTRSSLREGSTDRRAGERHGAGCEARNAEGVCRRRCLGSRESPARPQGHGCGGHPLGKGSL